MPNIKEQKFPNKGIQSVGDTQMIKDSEGHYCSVCFEFYRENPSSFKEENMVTSKGSESEWLQTSTLKSKTVPNSHCCVSAGKKSPLDIQGLKTSPPTHLFQDNYLRKCSIKMRVKKKNQGRIRRGFQGHPM